MPPDKTATLVAEFKRLLDAENVLSAYSDLMVYECDGYVIEKNCPDVAVFPRNARQVAEIVKICNRHSCRAGRVRRWPADVCRWAAE